MGLKVPVYYYEDIRQCADNVLGKHHPSKTIPVPIEPIVEFGYSTTIIPLHELQRVYGIDAFVSHHLRTVYVDNSVMESRSPNRYRFSLAHELGHIVLHGDVFSEVEFHSVAEWKELIQSMKETDRRWLEWQAHAFAGLILVPKPALVERLKQSIELMGEQGLDFRKFPDIAKDYVCNWAGRFFKVSSQVVEKRIDKEGLWPPF